MAIYCFGSINIDHIYQLDNMPQAGETLASRTFSCGLGGKGANQSIAAASAGSTVHHIGAVGSDGEWVVQQLLDRDVDIEFVSSVESPTGHAIIYVDKDAENMIVLFDGANRENTTEAIQDALGSAQFGDWLVLQNETNLTDFAAKYAKEKGMKVAYSAAPFDVDSAIDVLKYVDLLAVNQSEAKQLRASLKSFTVEALLTTHGADGAELIRDSESWWVDGHKVVAIDTTGAGDTFLGYFVSSLDQGMSDIKALTRASAAAALQVSKRGAAEAIPTAEDVEVFLKTARTPA